MRRWIRGGLGLALVCLLSAFGCGSSSGKSTVAVPTFDGNRSYEDLVTQVNFGPRAPNSAAHTACLSWLKQTLGAQCSDVTDQSFTYAGKDGVTYTGDNIIAYFAGTAPAGSAKLFIGAHWDCRPVADQDPNPANHSTPIPGADDGASGVAALTEMARAFKAVPPPIPVELVAVDLEDMGNTPATTGEPYEGFCLGTRYFAANQGRFAPGQAIILDMIGYSKLSIPQEQYSMASDPALMSSIFGDAAALGYTQFVAQPGEYIIDDQKPLIDAGIPSIDLIDLNYPYWHTLADTADKCSGTSLKAVGQTLLQMIYTSTSSRGRGGK
jgi:hypothetical protein